MSKQKTETCRSPNFLPPPTLLANKAKLSRPATLSSTISVLDQPELDPAALALALRYRTTAERSFYKALHRLRTAIREDAGRAIEAEEKEASAKSKASLWPRFAHSPAALCAIRVKLAPPVRFAKLLSHIPSEK